MPSAFKPRLLVLLLSTVYAAHGGVVLAQTTTPASPKAPASSTPIEHWHEWIGEATVADAMLDRIMQSHHRLTLTGESLRKSKPQPEQEDIGA